MSTIRKWQSLGEFEEYVLLAVEALAGNAYGVTVRNYLRENADRDVSFGTVHNTLTRLEKKGLAASEKGEATAVRGGRAKLYYTITERGILALKGAEMRRKALRNPPKGGSPSPVGA